MPAPLGNRFWEARSTHGRSPIFATPQALLDAALQYFTWVEENPLYEDKLFAFQGAVTHAPAARMRAMSIGGLCIFIGISRKAWSEYCTREGYGAITDEIAEAIRTQKYEGAAADMLNANIIARDLGLVDRREVSDPTGAALAVQDNLSLARVVAFLLRKGDQELRASEPQVIEGTCDGRTDD